MTERIDEYEIGYIDTISKLRDALALCYRILGKAPEGTSKFWEMYICSHSKVMLYAHVHGKVISAVFGRDDEEDIEALHLSLAACDEEYRRRGITRNLLSFLERNARELRYKHVVLNTGPGAEEFYDRCGYRVVQVMTGFKVYKKDLY